MSKLYLESYRNSQIGLIYFKNQKGKINGGMIFLMLVRFFQRLPNFGGINALQLNKYETAPNFILLSQNLT